MWYTIYVTLVSCCQVALVDNFALETFLNWIILKYCENQIRETRNNLIWKFPSDVEWSRDSWEIANSYVIISTKTWYQSVLNVSKFNQFWCSDNRCQTCRCLAWYELVMSYSMWWERDIRDTSAELSRNLWSSETWVVTLALHQNKLEPMQISSGYCDWDLISDFYIQFQICILHPVTSAFDHIHKNDLWSSDEATTTSPTSDPGSSKPSISHVHDKQHQAITREAYRVCLPHIVRDHSSQMATQTKVRLFANLKLSIIGKRWEKAAFSFHL